VLPSVDYLLLAFPVVLSVTHPSIDCLSCASLAVSILIFFFFFLLFLLLLF
jgi:hypothetical protein